MVPQIAFYDGLAGLWASQVFPAASQEPAAAWPRRCALERLQPSSGARSPGTLLARVSWLSRREKIGTAPGPAIETLNSTARHTSPSLTATSRGCERSF